MDHPPRPSRLLRLDDGARTSDSSARKQKTNSFSLIHLKHIFGAVAHLFINR